MAEHQRNVALGYGHTGSLIYIPSKSPADGPGSLHTTRLTSNSPTFKLIGSSAELYPASRPSIPELPPQLWNERRLQRRWLIKSHPEAAMGNIVAQHFLQEDMEHSNVEYEAFRDGAVLATGHIADMRDRTKNRGVPALATAAGASGELLRLTLISETKWQWDKFKDGRLDLSISDSTIREEEVIWASDGLPITKIKFAAHSSQPSSTRWLLVQKKTSTFLMQPEYHGVPIPNDQLDDVFTPQHPSFIKPNSLLTLPIHQTGGNAHADMAFNPALLGRPPQVAIIDDCGYWSVWNVLGRRRTIKQTLRFSLYKCGHILDGTINEIPRFPSHPAGKHGILRICLPSEGQIDQADGSPGQAGSNRIPPQLFLLWNHLQLQIFDLDGNTSLYNVDGPLATMLRPGTAEHILDIQRSPIKDTHIIVLTTEQVIWVDLLHQAASLVSSDTSEFSAKPSILLTYSHLSTGDKGLKMSVCQSTDDNKESLIVLTYSSTSTKMGVYWFGLASDGGFPYGHSHLTILPGSEGATACAKVQLLNIQPARLSIIPGAPVSGPASAYWDNKVEFYQLNILRDDLSVRFCVCAVVKDPLLNIVLPTTRIGWTKMKIQKRLKTNRKRFLQRIGGAFVFPDEMTDDKLQSLFLGNESISQLEQPLETSSKGALPQALALDLRPICLTIRDLLEAEVSKSGAGFPITVFDAIREKLWQGVDNSKLPLTTWLNIADETDQLHKFEADDDKVEEGIEDLFREVNDQSIVTELIVASATGSSNPRLSLSYLQHAYSEFWLHPSYDNMEGSLQRFQTRVNRISREVFLSSYGVAVQDTPLFGSSYFGTSEGNEIFSLSQASQTLPSDPLSNTSSPSGQGDFRGPDDAIRRLQLLVSDIHPGRLGRTKPNSVLSLWPTERGIDTQDYVSSVDIAYDEKFRGARERLQKILAKRKKQSEKYKRPAFMGQGFPSSIGTGKSVTMAPVVQSSQAPPLQALSSQQVPSSSQTQAPSGPSFTMSQPVEGAFGARKKKKAKRKSGFR